MLKKFVKWTVIIATVLVLVLVIAVASLQNKTFDAPYPEVNISTDSAVLARGEYLVYGPGHCADCHGKVEMMAEKEAGEKVPLTGGLEFKLPLGSLYAPNLTPDPETGIGRWDDKTIARALRHGVGHDGRALFPFMPFQNTSKADMDAIISYLKTLPAVKNEVPENSFNAVGKIVKAFALKPVGPDGEVTASIKPDTTVEYGMYLANNVANCRGCHTNRDLKTGEYTSEFFSGGLMIESPIDPEHYACVTPNISTDPETSAISDWTEEVFINRFRKGKVIKHSVMAWGPFKRMSDNDLKAIYRYLHTVKPVKNKIEKTLVKLGE